MLERKVLSDLILRKSIEFSLGGLLLKLVQFLQGLGLPSYFFASLNQKVLLLGCVAGRVSGG